MAVCITLAAAAAGLTLYPLISNYLSEKSKSIIETQYTEAVEAMDTGEIDAARNAAENYNRSLAPGFTKDALKKAAESYDDLLNIRGDSIMGYVEIPAIGVDLPIYHGTTEETLDRGVGHLMGSALPVGGIGTHCVLTGHSGLAGKKMFSDLNRLKAGDVFYLHVLNDTLAYRVAEINTVLPEDTSLLGADRDKDSCTLVTCTPYGVNTHRLLVRGERIEYTEAVTLTENAEYVPVEESTWTEEYLKGLEYGAAGIAGICASYLAVRLFRKHRRPKKRGRHEKS